MNTAEINATLGKYDTYIVALSSKMLAASQSALCVGAEELAQRVRIKFWLALEKQQIIHNKMYIRQIVCHEIVNLWRQRRSEEYLSFNDEGELLHHNFNVMGRCESSRDPAEIVEQREATLELLSWAADQATKLPRKQRKALICELKMKVDDFDQLVCSFQAHQLAIEKIHWPEVKESTNNLKASLSLARKKFRQSWQQRA